MISEKASFSISMSTEQKGWVRSLMTMYSTTPSISQITATVTSTALRRLNSSEKDSVANITSALNRNTPGFCQMNWNSRAGDSPRLNSSTASASSKASAGRKISLDLALPVSYAIARGLDARFFCAARRFFNICISCS